MTRHTIPIGLVVLLAFALLGVVVAPAAPAFAGAVVMAAAWCRWLDAHPETVVEKDPTGSFSQELFRNSLAAPQAGTPIVKQR